MALIQSVIAVDLGGTKIAVAAVTPDGGVRGRVVRPTPATAGPVAVLDAVADAVRCAAPDGVRALGIGSAGSIDAERGVVLAATDSITDWAGTDLRSGLAARLDLPAERIAVENDVHAHARGEALAGAGAGHDPLLMVAVGTGVGGAVVVDGQVLRGATGQAGAIAHVPVPGAEGLGCTCGGHGHLEAIAAGPALLRAWAATGRAPLPHGRDLVALADDGDAAAREILTRAGGALGTGIAGLVATLDPAAVVVGGGLADGTSTIWWDAVVGGFRAQATSAWRDLPLMAAALGSDAALVGAGLRAHEVLNREGDH